MRVKNKSFLPVQDERPLISTVPKPSLVLAKPGSAFGFRPQTSESTTEAITSDHMASGGSMQRAEAVPDSQSDLQQSQDAVGMNLDPNEYGAEPEERGAGPSANANYDG
jgi:hypothetical protein